MKDSETKSMKYHAGILRGRHPRSFSRSADVWKRLDASTERTSYVKTGQSLSGVVQNEQSNLHPSSQPTDENEDNNNGIKERRRHSSMDFNTKQIKQTSIKTAHSHRNHTDIDILRRKRAHEDAFKRIQNLGKDPLRCSSSVSPLPTFSDSKQQPTSVSVSSTPAQDFSTNIRNDFNAQKNARIHYGSNVAFELFNNHLMMVGTADNSIYVQPLERLNHQPKGHKDRVVFTFINMNDLNSANAIQYGDSVWLQIPHGPGSSDHSNVLGAKVREAPHMETLTRGNSDVNINSSPSADIVQDIGFPTPIKAYLPKGREDGNDVQLDDLQARMRNKSCKMLARWTIRSAILQDCKNGNVLNNDEIYLEQDWFYISADLENERAVLRQLSKPCTKKNLSKSKKLKKGDYTVERRAAWRLHLVDSHNGGKGLSLVQQQMERLLYKAKNQLKNSEKMRNGELVEYANELKGGGEFCRQIRKQIHQADLNSDQYYFSEEEKKQLNLDKYFHQRYIATMPNPKDKTKKLKPLGHSPSAPLLHKSTYDYNQMDNPLEIQDAEVCKLCQASSSLINICTSHHQVLSNFQKTIESQKSPALSNSKSCQSFDTETMSPNVSYMNQLFVQEDEKLLNIFDTNEKESGIGSFKKNANIIKRFSEFGLGDANNPRKQANEHRGTCIEEQQSDSEESDLSNDSDYPKEHDYDLNPLSEEEINLMPCIDESKVFDLYGENESHFRKMLLGFEQVCKNSILPQLANAMEEEQKSLVIEGADFLAKASEFVAARRVQYKTMQLLLSITTSKARDFHGIKDAYDDLQKELNDVFDYSKKEVIFKQK